MDLCKPFDTVNKRLLWARLRSLGVYGKLLRVLCAGYGKRKDFFFGRMRLKKRSEFLANFERLVLGCIGAKFCK